MMPYGTSPAETRADDSTLAAPRGPPNVSQRAAADLGPFDRVRDRNGFPQAPHRSAPAPHRRDDAYIAPQSQTALTRTPPPDEPCRAAGPRKLRAVSRVVAALCAWTARCSRSIVERYRLLVAGVMPPGETAARMWFVLVFQPHLLGDAEETAVVVAARTRGVADAARGGDSVDGLVQQAFE